MEIRINVDGKVKLTSQGVTLCKLPLSACTIAGYLQHMAWKLKTQFTWMPKTSTHPPHITHKPFINFLSLCIFAIQLFPITIQWQGVIPVGYPKRPILGASTPKRSEPMQPWEVPCCLFEGQYCECGVKGIGCTNVQLQKIKAISKHQPVS